MQPCDALPYPAPQGFPRSGQCQGKFYYCSKETLGETANFCLSCNGVARVEPNSVFLLRGVSGQVSP